MSEAIIERNTTATEGGLEKERHNGQISENYKRLLDSTVATKPAAKPVHDRAPLTAEESEQYAAPMKFHERPMPSTASVRISTYVPHYAKPELRSNNLFEDVKYGTTPVANTATAPVMTVAAPAAPAPVAPVFTASAAAAPAMAPAAAPADDEDARPTRRTMDTLRRPAAAIAAGEENVSFFEAISSRMKAALIAIGVAIVVALVIICINSALIRSVNSDIESKEMQLKQLTKAARQLEDRIEDVTDPDNVGNWAQDNGMVFTQD